MQCYQGGLWLVHLRCLYLMQESSVFRLMVTICALHFPWFIVRLNHKRNPAALLAAVVHSPQIFSAGINSPSSMAYEPCWSLMNSSSIKIGDCTVRSRQPLAVGHGPCMVCTVLILCPHTRDSLKDAGSGISLWLLRRRLK